MRSHFAHSVGCAKEKTGKEHLHMTNQKQLNELEEASTMEAQETAHAEASTIEAQETAHAEASAANTPVQPEAPASTVDAPAANTPVQSEAPTATTDAPAANAPALTPQAVEEAASAARKHHHFHKERQEEKLILGKFKPSDLLKFGGLIAFALIMALAVVLLAPYIHMAFSPGGMDLIKEEITRAGVLGFLILLALQFLQIVLAFIPGEVVQLVAGALYGPWLGTLLIFIGCVGSSAFIYVLVHKLGAPFVQAVVPMKFEEKFRQFEHSGKLVITVFILFLIPGLPKDVFTYIFPLTDMPIKTFLLVSNVARIPGIFVSCFGAHDIIQGDYVRAAILLGLLALVAILCIWKHEQFINIVEKITKDDL